jgi:hypothetical protein
MSLWFGLAKRIAGLLVSLTIPFENFFLLGRQECKGRGL